MRVLLKNMGDAMRVVYDVKKKMHSIKPGSSLEVDLHEMLIDAIRGDMVKGGKFHVELPQKEEPAATTGRPRRVRVRGSERKLKPVPVTPTSVLAQAADLDYHTLLALTTKALGENHTLGQRPTKEQMLVALKNAVPPATAA